MTGSRSSSDAGGIAPDLIGFGRSSKGGHLDYSLDGLATFVEELLDHLGVERVSVIAHQWGAAVGAVLAARHPDLVARITAAPPAAADRRVRMAAGSSAGGGARSSASC